MGNFAPIRPRTVKFWMLCPPPHSRIFSATEDSCPFCPTALLRLRNLRFNNSNQMKTFQQTAAHRTKITGKTRMPMPRRLRHGLRNRQQPTLASDKPRSVTVAYSCLCSGLWRARDRDARGELATAQKILFHNFSGNFCTFGEKAEEGKDERLKSWACSILTHLTCISHCCDRKSRAAYAQTFALWQQATIETTCHDHSIIAQGLSSCVKSCAVLWPRTVAFLTFSEEYSRSSLFCRFFILMSAKTYSCWKFDPCVKRLASVRD